MYTCEIWCADCDRVPTARVLGHWTYRMTLIVTLVTCVLVTWAVNKSRLYKQANIGDLFDLCHIYRQAVGNGQVKYSTYITNIYCTIVQ